MIALEGGSILGAWVLAWQNEAPGHTGECRNASTQVVWKIPRESNGSAEESRELEVDQRAGEGAATGGRCWQGEHIPKAPLCRALLVFQSSLLLQSCCTHQRLSGALSPGTEDADSLPIHHPPPR